MILLIANDSGFGGRAIEHPSVHSGVPVGTGWLPCSWVPGPQGLPPVPVPTPACFRQKTASGRSSTGQPRCCWTRCPQPRRQATRRSSSTCSSSASLSSTSPISSRPVSSSPLWPSSSTTSLPRVPSAGGRGAVARPVAQGVGRAEWHRDLGPRSSLWGRCCPTLWRLRLALRASWAWAAGGPEVYYCHQHAPGPDCLPLPRGQEGARDLPGRALISK